MYRKILGIGMAFAALTIVLPATASASLTLEDTSGGTTVSLAVGSKIKAISEGTSLFEGGGIKIECNENFLTGEVVKNNGSQFEATITDGKFQSNLTSNATDCSSGLGPMTFRLPLTNEAGGTKHWCIRSNEEEDTFSFFGKNCGTAGTGELTFTFAFHTIFGEIPCSYSRLNAFTGSFTTETAGHAAATLALTGEPEFTLTSGSSTCPANVKVKSLNFKLYTDLAAVTNEWDDTASTEAPVWISDRA